MSERSEYAPGEFCWVDVAVPDVGAAAGFYGDLLGWRHEPAPGPPEETGGYGTFFLRDKPVAGIGPIMQEGQPPAWSSYVSVADADETAGEVTEAGGSVVVGPMDIPGGAGRMAVCHDSEGAFFSLWQPGEHIGARLVNEVGTWTWNNLFSRDPDAAAEFYGAVFGWTRTQEEGSPDWIWGWHMEGERWPDGLGNLMAMGSDIPAEAPPYWQVYFAVADLDAAIEQTKGAGGSLMFGPQEVPVGRVAVLFDPQGAAFSLIEPDYPEPR